MKAAAGEGRAGEQSGALTLDPIARELTYFGRGVRLTPAQTSVMYLLMHAAPDPVAPGAIWKAVRGYVPARPTAAVRVLMHSLRRACERVFDEELVETVLGQGYRLARDVRIEALTDVSEN